MDINSIMMATIVVGIVGLTIALFLGIASKVFYVEVDLKEELINEALPGNNCGGCGYAGCSGLAKAIAGGVAEVDSCPVGGAAVASTIAEIMGVKATNKEREVAYVACNGTCNNAKMDYEYTGVNNCNMLAFVPSGGPKTCKDGCLGCGTCVAACQFDGIKIVDNVAVVNQDRCMGCGKCIEACPKDLIKFKPFIANHFIACSSKEKGPVASKSCSVACIACGICVKNCPNQAIQIVDMHAIIDYSKCTNCGICASKCPKKCFNQ